MAVLNKDDLKAQVDSVIKDNRATDPKRTKGSEHRVLEKNLIDSFLNWLTDKASQAEMENDVSPSDSKFATPAGVWQAIAKALENIGGGLSYKGTWNAATNSPAIPAAAPENNGWYYKVAVAGTTSISGINEWAVGDWVISAGTEWQKIDNSEIGVTAGNGLNLTSNIFELGNLTKNTEIDGNFNFFLGNNTALLNFLAKASNNITIEGAGQVSINRDTFKYLRIGAADIYLSFGSSGTSYAALIITSNQIQFFSTNDGGTTSSQIISKKNGDIEIYSSKSGVTRGYTITGTDGLKEIADYKATYGNRTLVAKDYVDNLTTNVRKLISDLDCSANPNYPAATKGDSYQVSVAGKIGGASGVNVNVGDEIVCKTTNAGGTQAAVGTSWYVLESNREEATTSTLGVVRRATNAEVKAGNDTTKYIAPADLMPGIVIGQVIYPKNLSELNASFPNAKNGQMVAAYTGNYVVGYYVKSYLFVPYDKWLFISENLAINTLASMPANLPFDGGITIIGTKASPLSDLTIPAPSGTAEGSICIIYMKRDDAQIPAFASALYLDYGCPFIQGVVNRIQITREGGVYVCSSSQELVNPSASGLSITSLFNFGAYANLLEGDLLTAVATVINPAWNWLKATDSAGAGEVQLNSLQTYTLVGNEGFVSFKVKGIAGMFQGAEVKLTPFKPVKSITEDSNWSADFISTNGTFPTTNAKFARNTGATNAPTLITGAGVGFSGNHISIVTNGTPSGKLYFTSGGTGANLPQIPVSAQLFFFEVEVWCNADKDLRFRMDDNELFSEWYQDGQYGASVTPPVFRAFNTVVTKRIIVRHNQNTSNSRFSIETTGVGNTGDEIRHRINRAGLISA